MSKGKPNFNLKAYKHAISMVESSGGKYLKNGDALGRYQFIYRYIKDTPEMKGVSKRQFMNDRDLQEKIMDKALTGTLKGFTYGPDYAQKFIKENNSNMSVEDATALVHFLGPGDAKKAIENPETFKVPGVNLTVDEYLGKFKTNYQRYQKHEDWMNKNQNEENPIQMAYDKNGMAILREDANPDQPFVATEQNQLPTQPEQNIQGDPAGFSPEGVAIANLPDQSVQPENMPNAGGIMRIENQDNQPSLQEGFMRLEDQMNVQGLQLTGQKSDPGEDRYKQNKFEGGGGLFSNMNLGFDGLEGGQAAGAGAGAEGAGAGGPGIGAYVGAAGAALDLGTMAFSKSNIDTSGMTAPEEVPSKGSAALSGAMKGASAGMAFGPWGAAIGGGVGAIAGVMGNAKAEKAADKAHLNYTSRKHDQATGMYELGGSIGSSDSSPVNGASELVTLFEGGGTHEQNSLGGIPQGMGANGKPNLVEEGETKFEDYIFSNNINMDGTITDKEGSDKGEYKNGGNLYEEGGTKPPTKDKIKYLQQLLFNEGLLDEDGVDGYWGPGTQAAYKAFEERTSGKSTSGIIPLQVKSLWNDITGSNPNSMDRNSLDSPELKALQQITRGVLASGRNKITYNDYDTDRLSQADGSAAIEEGTMSTYDKLTDPMYKLKTTLGQAKIMVTPQNDTLVMDTYDFNNNDGTGNLTKLREAIAKNSSPYNIARQIGTNYGSQDKEGATVIINTNETPDENEFRKGGMLKRADGSYSKRGLWDNIRANKGSGKKPTKAMLAQERKINKKEHGGELHDPPLGFGEGVTDSKRARDLARANYKNELETNPNQLDGESEEQYALRNQQFQNRRMENTSGLEKAYLNMKGNQDSLDMLPRIAADVATSPVDLAYYLKQQLDTNDTNKNKSDKTKNQEHFESAKSLIDMSALFTGVPITSLGKKSAFNLSKRAAPIAAPIMNAALREIGIEATSEEIGQISELANSYDQYKTKDLSLLTDLTESKKNTMDELMKAIRKQKRLASAKKKNNKNNKA